MEPSFLIGMAAIFFALSIGTMLYGSANYRRMLSMLREKHVDTWKDLGCPGQVSFGPSGTDAQNRLRRYLEQRDYLRSGDPDFMATCERSRRMLYVQIAIFMLFLLSVLAVHMFLQGQ